MNVAEINFDGLVGPSHNYAGLSFGNLAATRNAGAVAHPRAAAKQGLDKMRGNMALGLVQGFFPPLPRPNTAWLNRIGARHGADRALIAAAWSASSMWTANAATVSPAADTQDGRCHLTVANLVTMAHRGQEWPDTLKLLLTAFGPSDHFAVHAPVPASFGDEGAANHMRMAQSHSAAGIEIFVYGRAGGRFPARQHEQASRAVARLHRLDPARVLFIEQNPDAIAAGAFHNDVVAVANEHVLFAHERAFAGPEAAYDAIRRLLPGAEIIIVPETAVSLDEAVRTYLFNAQLVTLPGGEMALIVPGEARESEPVWRYLQELLAGNGPIRRVVPVDIRQSMANGGGPACLRLRVVADPALVDPRFLLSEAKADRIDRIIEAYWPQEIDPADIGDPHLGEIIVVARAALLRELGLTDLL